MLYRIGLLILLLVEYYLLAFYYIRLDSFDLFVEYAVSDPKGFTYSVAFDVGICLIAASMGTALAALLSVILKAYERPYYIRFRRILTVPIAIYLLFLFAVWVHKFALGT